MCSHSATSYALWQVSFRLSIIDYEIAGEWIFCQICKCVHTDTHISSTISFSLAHSILGASKPRPHRCLYQGKKGLERSPRLHHMKSTNHAESLDNFVFSGRRSSTAQTRICDAISRGKACVAEADACCSVGSMQVELINKDSWADPSKAASFDKEAEHNIGLKVSEV